MNELLRTILVLPEQRSTIAQDIDTLHYLVILVTMAGATAVALAALVLVIYYRRSANRGGYQPPDERSGRIASGIPYWIEFLVIGGLLSLFLVFWVIGYHQFVRIRVPPDNAQEVYVMGKKWMWSFAYPDGRGSNAVLYVPAHQPIKLVMTSRDVIHSFFVPEFRIKQDVLPGRTTIAWFEANAPGAYDILCTEYCGTGHSTMRGTVVVLSPEDYEQMLDEPGGLKMAQPTYTQPAVLGRVFGPTGREPITDQSLTSLAEQGEIAAGRLGCLRCHTVDGTPHIGPTWARAYGSRITLTTGETNVVDEQYLTESMMDPLAKIHAGFEPVMPSYLGQMSAAETGAIVEYIKTLRDVPVDTPLTPLPTEERLLVPGLPRQGRSAEELPIPEQGPPQPGSLFEDRRDQSPPARLEGPPAPEGANPRKQTGQTPIEPPGTNPPGTNQQEVRQ